MFVAVLDVWIVAIAVVMGLNKISILRHIVFPIDILIMVWSSLACGSLKDHLLSQECVDQIKRPILTSVLNFVFGGLCLYETMIAPDIFAHLCFFVSF